MRSIVCLFVPVKDTLVVPRHSNQSPPQLLFTVAVKAVGSQRETRKVKIEKKQAQIRKVWDIFLSSSSEQQLIWVLFVLHTIASCNWGNYLSNNNHTQSRIVASAGVFSLHLSCLRLIRKMYICTYVSKHVCGCSLFASFKVQNDIFCFRLAFGGVIM